MTRKKQKGEVDHQAIRAPKPFAYGFFLFLMRILFKLLYRIRCERDPALAASNGPFFIVGNHVAYFDPAVCAAAMPDQRIRFVAGQEIANWKVLGAIFRKLGIIEIKPFRVNFSTTKEIILTIAHKCSVALYPETQRSMAGNMTPFGLATAKLIKHLKAPVAAVICRGGYLGWPRWAGLPRPGRMEVKTRLLLTAEETVRFSVDEIQGRLVKVLNVDDYAWQSERKRPVRFFSRRRAEKLSYICHWCPSCDRPLAMRSEKRKLFCSVCELSLRVDAAGFFSASPGSPAPFDHPLEHASWQRKRMEEELLSDRSLESGCRMILLENLGESDDPACTERFGKLILSRNGLSFLDDRDVPPIRFAIESTPSLYCDPGHFVNLPDDEIIWRAYPDEEGFVALLTDYSRYAWSRDNHFDRFLSGH
ncbi:MAG: 1-acyl-sn-glycerol-3-phosphate acyltransferase [Clostridiaceae bacterium]|nr:1-acyl-sn-glycerol-3-phosphate acyltransferase [Clostridiaceae bacterium]